MWNGLLAATLIIVSAASPALAQRPRIGIGIGAGVILGSRLIDHDFSIHRDDSDVVLTQEVSLEDVGVISGHAEWHVIPNIAIRAHAAWGDGRLAVRTSTASDAADDALEGDLGDVGIRTLDAGISVWPWAPGTTGFTPFLTVGVGQFLYDFDAVTGDGLFHAEGDRSERSWFFGIGADMHIWRSITLRMEAVDHRVRSPLRPGDFAVAPGSGEVRQVEENVNNVRLVVGAHIYLPFRSDGLSEAR